jgi:hypothetical protein
MEKAMELKFRLAGCLAFGVLIMAMAGPAFAQQKKRVVPPAPAASVVVWGDDIGQSNVSAYTNGLMGYRTPNIDSIAQEVMSRKDAEDAFFSAIKANIDDMSSRGREAWCSAIMKAAKR